MSNKFENLEKHESEAGTWYFSKDGTFCMYMPKDVERHSNGEPIRANPLYSTTIQENGIRIWEWEPSKTKKDE